MVPFAPKVLKEPTVVEGVTLRAGTGVDVDRVGLGLDAGVFPHPQVFDVTRFRRGEYRDAQLSTIAAFGLGPRACVGRRLAEAEAVSFLAHVLDAFTVSAPAGAPPIAEEYVITMRPKDLRLVFTPDADRATELSDTHAVPKREVATAPPSLKRVMSSDLAAAA